MAAGSTDDQWAGERVRRWVAQAAGLDRQLAPVSDLLFDGAALQAGERVLDVGCGTGPTTRTAATAVGPDGQVIGIDISAAMLEAAAAADAPPGAAPIEWLEADVAVWQPTVEPVDVVISRFGIMFFDDPEAAFAALAAATRPGGRFCALVWDRRDRSAMFQVPFAVTTRVLREHGLEPEDLPLDGGAFSLHDPARVAPLLDAGGWSDVEVESAAIDLRVGGGLTPEDAAEVALSVGPSRILTSALGTDVREHVQSAIAAELAGHVDAGGHVVLGGSVVRITARRG